MKVGDKVIVTTPRGARKLCFGEEIVNRRSKNTDMLECVSLYGVDGRYIGDYWEDEITPTGKTMTEDELFELIKEFIDMPGTAKDFARVLGRLGTDWEFMEKLKLKQSRLDWY